MGMILESYGFIVLFRWVNFYDSPMALLAWIISPFFVLESVRIYHPECDLWLSLALALKYYSNRARDNTTSHYKPYKYELNVSICSFFFNYSGLGSMLFTVTAVKPWNMKVKVKSAKVFRSYSLCFFSLLRMNPLFYLESCFRFKTRSLLCYMSLKHLALSYIIMSVSFRMVC